MTETDPDSVGTNVYLHRWPWGLLEAFPPFSPPRDSDSENEEGASEMHIYNLHRPRRPLFSLLMDLTMKPPLQLPQRQDIISRDCFFIQLWTGFS